MLDRHHDAIATAAHFNADAPSGGPANENTYPMHDPSRLPPRRHMPARLRIDFLHQDSPPANPPLPLLFPSA